jgi:hypothetical protein
VGAGVFSSADLRLCEAASTSGFTSPIPLIPRHPKSKRGQQSR